MNSYSKALEVMTELFSKDCQFALATCADGVPSVRFVDTYYDDGCFYVVTYANTRKMKEIHGNENVGLSGIKLYSFSGKARDMGHPLSPCNKEIRDKLIKVFEPWYFRHNNENDDNMCYLRIEPSTGFIHSDGTGYNVDFVNKTATEFPFKLDITLEE